MEAKIYYTEIVDFVKAKYGHAITIADRTSKSVSVVYTIKALIFSKNMTLDISIEEVTPTSIILSYGGSIGVATVVTGALAVLKAKMPEIDSAIHHKDGRTIEVELNRIEKLKPILEYLSPDTLTFTSDALILSLKLK